MAEHKKETKQELKNPPVLSAQKFSPQKKDEPDNRQSKTCEKFPTYYHWADFAAQRVIREKGDKKNYTVAAGITPSGVIHIGNFREIMTVALVAQALKDLGKKVRFIYSWDDYDVFRKVPIDLPKQEEMAKFLRKPVVDTMDPWGCHQNYAEHNEKAVEDILPQANISPEFIYQHKMYRACKYAENIRTAMRAREKIRNILDKYREEPLKKEWLPLSAYCPKCNTDQLKISEYDEEYSVKITCKCGYEEKVDFRKCGHIKLPWRLDWPMRWFYEKVDFEPGGKDHSTPGGSRDTGQQIVKAVYDFEAPVYQRYDFVTVKGQGGKISKSKGGVVTLIDVLEIYGPEVTRYLFAGTRPDAEFAISFDLDVLKIYEDFDRCERIYYGLEKVSEKELEKQKRIYELSVIHKIPKKMPLQWSFRHLTTILQIHELDIEKTIGYYEKELKNKLDKERLKTRAICVKNWLQKEAPEDFRFTVQLEPPHLDLNDNQKNLIKTLIKKLQEKDWTDVDLHNEFYILSQNHNLQPPELFKLVYQIIINKERGPRLASFILQIGKEKVISLLEKV